MAIQPVEITLSEKFWKEELELQDLPKDLIIFLRELIVNHLESGISILSTRGVSEMAKNEISYLVIGQKRYAIKTLPYFRRDTFLFFLHSK